MNKVGPQLRQAARRALRSGDSERMRIVARVIVSELLRRGDLIRVAMAGQDEQVSSYFLIRGTHRLLDLSSLGLDFKPVILDEPGLSRVTNPAPPEAPETKEGSRSLQDLSSMLLAMEDAQKLDLSNPRSGETGVILDSILRLLEKFTPQFHLRIMLFEGREYHDPAGRVFLQGDERNPPPWLRCREKAHSVWIPNPRELPQGTLRPLGDDEGPASISCGVAVPLFAPQAGGGLTWTSRSEEGLLFVLAGDTWSRDTMLRLATRLSRFVTTRWQQHTEVTKRIHIDALTGLYNRAYFEGQLEILLERAKRNDAPLTLVVADIDRFKDVNDNYDHVVGDQVLRMVARRMQEELRRIDHICRLGGEEFALILPDTGLEAAQEVLQRLLNAQFVENTEFEGQPVSLPITFSYGAVTYPQSGTDAFELYRKADTLLFLSKDRGRNQCHFWSSDGNHQQLIPESGTD